MQRKYTELLADFTGSRGCLKQLRDTKAQLAESDMAVFDQES